MFASRHDRDQAAIHAPAGNGTQREEAEMIRGDKTDIAEASG